MLAHKQISYRPVKSVWHGSGLAWEGGTGPGGSSPAGTCQGWQSDSPLEVGLATRLGDATASLLAAQRSVFTEELDSDPCSWHLRSRKLQPPATLEPRS
jgi:hypothetical protein